MLVAAETYLLVTKLAGWDLDRYQDWLTVTLGRLAAGQPDARPGTARRSAQ